MVPSSLPTILWQKYRRTSVDYAIILSMDTCVQQDAFSRRHVRKTGQTMLEYVIVFTVLVAVFFALWGFLNAGKRDAKRSVALMASEYP